MSQHFWLNTTVCSIVRRLHSRVACKSPLYLEQLEDL
jgi:hypothetical protein